MKLGLYRENTASLEAVPVGEPSIEAAGENVYSHRIERLEQLGRHKAERKKFKNRVEQWRTVRIGSGLAPLICAAVVATPSINHDMSGNQMAGSIVGGCAVAVGTFLFADARRKNAFRRQREAGLVAVPIVEELGINGEFWIEEALQPDKDRNPYTPPAVEPK